MEMKVNFPSGKKVNASYNGYVIETDQPKKEGGEGSAPAPFDLFLASMGTCAGIYVQGFCQQRGIDAKGVELTQSMEYDNETKLIKKVNISIHLPSNFPVKYKAAITKAASLCTVKRHMMNPPEMSVSAEMITEG